MQHRSFILLKGKLVCKETKLLAQTTSYWKTQFLNLLFTEEELHTENMSHVAFPHHPLHRDRHYSLVAALFFNQPRHGLKIFLNTELRQQLSFGQ